MTEVADAPNRGRRAGSQRVLRVRPRRPPLGTPGLCKPCAPGLRAEDAPAAALLSGCKPALCPGGLAGRDPVTPAGAAAHPQAGTRSAGATMVRGRATAEGKADTGRGA